MKTIYTLLFSLLIIALPLRASHILGGEIQAIQLNNQNYKIVVKLAMDQINGASAINAENSVLVCFGDGQTGTLLATNSYTATDDAGVIFKTFEGEHEYTSPGNYQISVQRENRVDGILNLPEGDQNTLFLWTILNTQMANSTPQFPDLKTTAGLRQNFKQALAPIATEADSLSYRIVKISKASPGTCGVRMINHSYSYPNDVSKEGLFYIDRSNQLVWTAPTMEGRYLYAIVAKEWREGVVISETYREATLTVVDGPGEVVDIPPYQPVDANLVVAGDSNPEVEIDVLAYPNPSDDHIRVVVTSRDKLNIKIQVLNTSGQAVKQYSTSSPAFSIEKDFSLKAYGPGLYLINVSTSLGSQTKKIVIK
ncbi:putative secreted protein (Por secretion system target) [Dyadobacter jejuensis]|uniref:Putative secreted protein (Por secretion system target) n=1 Tax=Dyadobacter jejuensis TaxID=1082580 RepID=A0A316AGA5_9BACT|nr:T9SS type A sorting domain-containing protein [Dyadobacter jejuensis]PWJ56733.1 putative secreted protein (Por secretion system target) [Dyadobacter jejuensis]